MSYPEINLIAVLVGVVLSVVVGSMWYGPLFGKAWMKNKGLKESDLSGAGSAMAWNLLFSIIGMLIAAVIIGWSGASTWFEGTKVGLLLATFAGCYTFNNVIYDNPKGIGNRAKDWFLNLGYLAVYLAIAGAVLAVW